MVPPLTVSKIELCSPGFLDFTGVNRLLKLIKDTIFQGLSYPQDKKLKSRQINKAEIENKLLELDVIQKQINILKGIGFEDEQIRKMISSQVTSLELLNGLIKEGKIKAIK